MKPSTKRKEARPPPPPEEVKKEKENIIPEGKFMKAVEGLLAGFSKLTPHSKHIQHIAESFYAHCVAGTVSVDEALTALKYAPSTMKHCLP